MSKFFKMEQPKLPPMPGIDYASAGKRARDETDDMLRKKGAGYNILTTESGLPDLGVTARKKLEKVA